MSRWVLEPRLIRVKPVARAVRRMLGLQPLVPLVVWERVLKGRK